VPNVTLGALKVFRRLLLTIPQRLKGSFGFLGAWLGIACTKEGREEDSVLKAKWQTPPAERRMIAWMQKRTDYLNGVPAADLARITGTGFGRDNGDYPDPQECFNKALELVAALQQQRQGATFSQNAPSRCQKWRLLSPSSMHNC
jgi:hypothetical protein